MLKKNRNIILSTVGTSLLTNKTSVKEERELLSKYSNCKENECPNELINLVDRLYPIALEDLKSFDNHTLRRVSAELNGILGFYEEDFLDRAQDLHFLICTDTYQGIKTAEILKSFLNQKNIPVEIFESHNLSTKNKDAFSEGIKSLLKWCDDNIYNFKLSGYKIIFNLTGGFKSLQGYLNTIAMFYADSIIYIFESEQAELIQIPRLPIQIDPKPFVDHRDKFLLLNANQLFSANDFNNVPESIFDEIDGSVVFSLWGEMIWNKLKYDLFDTLPQLPFIKYHSNFIKKYKEEVDKSLKMKLIETIAKASVLLSSNNGNKECLSKGGIQYSPLTSKQFEGNQVYHFRTSLSIRVNCIEKDKHLLLTEFGTHDQTQS